MYLILCWSSFITICWEKKSHIKSQSQYFGEKSQLDYFPKSFSPNLDQHLGQQWSEVTSLFRPAEVSLAAPTPDLRVLLTDSI